MLVPQRNRPSWTVLAWKTGDKFPRVAHVEILNNESNPTWVALVDLRQAKLASLEQIAEGAQPALTDTENKEADAIIRADNRGRTPRARMASCHGLYARMMASASLFSVSVNAGCAPSAICSRLTNFA